MDKNWVVHTSVRDAKELTREQACYMAGFIDGEGTISVYLRPSDGNLSHTWAGHLSAYNTKVRVLELFQEWTGVGGIYGRGQRKDEHKDSYSWVLSSGMAVHVLRQVEPFLILKRRQAQIVLEIDRLRAECREGNWVRYTDKQLERVSALIQEIRSLNEQGSLTATIFQRHEDADQVRRIRPKSEVRRPGSPAQVCSVEGCETRVRHSTGGLCAAHAEQKRLAELVRKCEECGAEFQPKKDGARFCGAKCQMWNSYKRREGKGQLRTVACEFCGTEFETTDGRKRFCSLKCGWTAGNERKKAKKQQLDDS